MYDVFLFAYDNGLMISKGENFGENGCSGTDTFGTDTMAETKFGDGAGLGATIVDCGVNFDGNVG